MAPVSSSSSSHIDLPPGFRFYPTDEELVVHYLCRKAASLPFAVPVIADVDLYKFDPWELPEKALFGEKEWYFFSPRDRKYPNGSRPNRAAGSGYWKATGTDKPIAAMPGGRIAGVKKALVFYKGKAPRGIKTNWIMHEYRLPSRSSSSSSFSSSIRKKGNLRLDDWVLCRIYKKVYGAQKAAVMKDLAAAESSSCVEEDSSVPASPPRGLDLMAGGPLPSTIHSGANMEYMTSLGFPSQGPNVLGEPVPAGQSLVHKEIAKEEEDPKLLFNQNNFLHHHNNNNIRSINTSSTMNMNMNIGIAGMAGFENATLHGSKYYNHHQHQQGSTTGLGCLHLQNMPSLSHSAGSFLASLAAELL